MIINVKVKQNSNENTVEKTQEGYLIGVKEKAEDNKANIAVIKLLSKYFKVSSLKIKIKSGQTSRNKVITLAE